MAAFTLQCVAIATFSSHNYCPWVNARTQPTYFSLVDTRKHSFYAR